MYSVWYKPIDFVDEFGVLIIAYGLPTWPSRSEWMAGVNE